MKISYLTTLLTINLLSESLAAPSNEAYTISLPTNLNLANSGSFSVSLKDCTIADNDTINLDFGNSFTLIDDYGKANITGTISNSKISFSKNNSSSKNVSYSINNASAGKWSGNINVSIALDRKAETNLLMDGPSINSIFKSLSPTTITFSHNAISGNYLYDLSLAQDKSILLYKNGNDVTITNKINSPIKANENMSSLFQDLEVTSINNLNYIDMSTCRNMESMFSYCENITSLDVSGLNTSNVTNMSHLFYSMHNLVTLTGLENFNVGNVETFAYLLSDDKKLGSIPNLTGWNVSTKCTNLSHMFNCIGYVPGDNKSSVWPTTEMNFSSWKVDNVTDMSYMFMNAFMLTNINLSSWNTSKLVNMESMFEMSDSVCKSRLETITGIDNFNVSNVTNMSKAFMNCRSLVTESGFSSWSPTKVTTLNSTFYDCRKLNLHNFDNWKSRITNFSSVDITDCFGSRAGSSSSSGSYKPQW